MGNRPNSISNDWGSFNSAPHDAARGEAKTSMRSLYPLRFLFCVSWVFWTLGIAAEPIEIEAENAETVVSPAYVVSEGGAIGGRCVNLGDEEPPDRRADDPGASLGRLVIPFQITEPTLYYVWGRIKWHCRCSRAFDMRTTARPSDTGVKGQEDESGRFELPSNPATEWSLYSAASAPGAWQWLLLGAYLFETGPQKMEFVQRGHATMIDRFVLTSDADFRPPGFMREKEMFRLSHNPPSWRTAANAEEVSKAIQGVSAVTEQAAAGSEQMASSSEELGAQAAALRELVGQFRVGSKSDSHGSMATVA